jgi:hypothetical protein
VGRHLLYVDFDSGQSLMVFVDDIAVEHDGDVVAGS